jgi:hypothetical protein
MPVLDDVLNNDDSDRAADVMSHAGGCCANWPMT